MEQVVILSAARTAIGTFGGGLKDVPAQELGKQAIEAGIARAGIDSGDIDEVLFGCVLQGGQGQNMARQCAMKAGIPAGVPAMTINKVCGSGLRTISLAAQTIKAGDSRLVVAGGTENMSRAGYYLPGARFGYRMGNQELVDSMVRDGLWDVFNDYHMGMTAENIADRYSLSRQEQDAFAAASHHKAEAAVREGRFKAEIVPVAVKGRKGDTTLFQEDEHIRFGLEEGKLATLRAAFKSGGSVTAGNASGINDGAAALVVASESYAIEKGLAPMARILGYADTGIDPAVMGLGPIAAVRKALDRSGLGLSDIGLFEINEAFAAQSIAVIRELGLDEAKVNVNGGAIALGHPIGASGARIVVTLLHAMKSRGVRYGVAALCIGGGMGTALVVENLSTDITADRENREA